MIINILISIAVVVLVCAEVANLLLRLLHYFKLTNFKKETRNKQVNMQAEISLIKKQIKPKPKKIEPCQNTTCLLYDTDTFQNTNCTELIKAKLHTCPLYTFHNRVLSQVAKEDKTPVKELS